MGKEGGEKGSHRLQTPVLFWRNKGKPFYPLGINTSTFKLVICTWGEEYADEGIRKMLGGKGSCFESHIYCGGGSTQVLKQFHRLGILWNPHPRIRVTPLFKNLDLIRGEPPPHTHTHCPVLDGGKEAPISPQLCRSHNTLVLRAKVTACSQVFELVGGGGD